jgi:hypothetical protein
MARRPRGPKLSPILFSILGSTASFSVSNIAKEREREKERETEIRKIRNNDIIYTVFGQKN